MNMQVQITQITKIATEILKKYNFENREIDIIIEHLLEQDLMERHSHGFYRLASIVKNVAKNKLSKEKIKIDKKGVTSATIDGGFNLGLVVAEEGCKLALELAEQTGIGLVGVTNYIGTTGAMGHYTREIANKGMIGIVFCNSEYAVAPWGGKEAILGTNPISIGIPTNTDSIIVDFSTSARSYGELMLMLKEGKSIPKGIVLDKNGNESTNPNDANNGCQLPMSEHKGYGLGLVIEILAGILVGGKAGKNAVLGTDGMLILTIDPQQFMLLSEFKDNVNLLIDEIKNSALAPGFSEIRIPGEASYKKYYGNKKTGFVEINSVVFEEIKSLI